MSLSDIERRLSEGRLVRFTKNKDVMDVAYLSATQETERDMRALIDIAKAARILCLESKTAAQKGEALCRLIEVLDKC